MSKYIKLEDALNVCRLKPIIQNGTTTGVSYPTAKEIVRELSDLPTIEVGGLIDRRCLVGKWKEHYYPHFEVAGIKCSICDKDVPYWERGYKEPKFCPNCGVRMESDNE